jgi:hypothetical protein
MMRLILSTVHRKIEENTKILQQRVHFHIYHKLCINLGVWQKMF